MKNCNCADFCCFKVQGFESEEFGRLRKEGILGKVSKSSEERK